jgi:hypothetical protein
MLRHCIMQMQRQTHSVDHAIFVNSEYSDEPGDPPAVFDSTSLRYDALLEEAASGGAGRVFLGYGKSGSFHENYKAALALANLDDYDLFLKVDDDDIYMRNYAADVVADFVANRWDYSGTHTQGMLNGRRWSPDDLHEDLGLDFEDLDLGVPCIMPPTMALSRRALDVGLASEDLDLFDDIQWRRAIARRRDLVMAVRRDRNFVYNIHGENASTGTWLRT